MSECVLHQALSRAHERDSFTFPWARAGRRHGRMTDQMQVAAYFPIFFTDGWHAHTCLSICQHLRSPGLALELHVPASDASGRHPFVCEAVPPLLARAAYRLGPTTRLIGKVHRFRFRQALKRANVAYFWAGTPEPVYRDAKAARVPIFVERINCHRATAFRILDEAYRRAGLSLPAKHDLASLEEERRKLALADFIFAPSPLVRQSLLDEGHPPEKILSSSYGWSPERFRAPSTPRAANAQTSFLFVGSVCIRKGAHLLLEAWEAAGAPGRLTLAGRLLQEVRQVAGKQLARPDVNARGHVSDVASAYADADVFVLPTLEEGSPLVVYEAMACGLPVLTTPMGAGEVVRDGVEGIVLDPYDGSAWVAALQRLAGDPQLRARLGAAGRERAQDYIWAKVAARRRSLLEQALAARTPRARTA